MAPRVTKSYKQELKKRILLAAFEEFSKRGYDRANLDNVAKSVGIARGTIYLYFRSKREILESLSELQLSRLRDLLEKHDWISGDIASSAKSFYRESKQNLPNNSEWMALEMMAESSRNPELRRQRLLESRKMQQIIVDVMQSQMGQRKADAKEMREIALSAIALYSGLNMLKVLGYADEEIENSWAQTISFIVGGETKRLKKAEQIEKLMTRTSA